MVENGRLGLPFRAPPRVRVPDTFYYYYCSYILLVRKAYNTGVYISRYLTCTGNTVTEPAVLYVANRQGYLWAMAPRAANDDKKITIKLINYIIYCPCIQMQCIYCHVICIHTVYTMQPK